MSSSNWVSISKLSEITGKDRATITKRLEGIEHRIGNKNAKNYEKDVALAAIFGSEAAVAESDAKERRARAEAEKAELIVAKLRGELVSSTAMKTAAAELIKTLYQRIVRVTPSILASRCVGKTSIEIETLSREELSTIFNELKTMPENFLSVEADETVEELTDDDTQ
jgi:hypothetical protein